MKLQWKVPVNIMISGTSKDSLYVTTSFKYKEMNCLLSLEGDDSLYLDTELNKKTHFRTLKILVICIDGSKELISDLLLQNNRNKLMKIIQKVTNLIIRAIRNFGMAAHLHEFDISHLDSEYLLGYWNLEISESIEWTPFINKNYEWFMKAYSKIQDNTINQSRINSSEWASIESAIQNDLTPPPEREFTVNSIEHIDLRNFRLAVIESVIGLEIVLTRFCTAYLTNYKGFSKNKIEEFLNPNFGLTSRLSGLLDLMIDPKDLKNLDIAIVKSVVKWRNHIVHKSGNLPEGISEEQLRKGIINVLTLTFMLGQKTGYLNKFPNPLLLGNGLV